MIARSDVVRHLDTLLDSPRVKDYGPNGLQVEGRSEIRVLATACTASQRVINEAVAVGADALLVHHGLLWGREQPITGLLQRRLKALLAAECSLLAYHLPLDAHGEVGNNAVLLRRLGLTVVQPFARHHGLDIGWIGELATPLSPEDFAALVQRTVNHGVLHCPGTSALIRRVGVVTGGGQSHLADAAAAGCDAFITGEGSEQTWHEAAELGCHAFIAGHHATEDLAVHELGAQLATLFALDHRPIKLGNPV
jgi:dinuclear metal center YbgI/SA1388 family protein